MLKDFSGKNVLITGGSRGIGKACAMLFSALQANVIITYKSNVTEANNTLKALHPGGNHCAYQLNISQAADIERFFQTLLQDYGQLHVLINNAGVYIRHELANVSYADWQACWNETINQGRRIKTLLIDINTILLITICTKL